MVTSNISNLVRPVGSTVALTCTVELSPAVDVSVNVNTVWTGPAVVTLPPISPVMESLTRYTSTARSTHLGEINLESTPVQLLSAQHLHSSVAAWDLCQSESLLVRLVV